MGVWMKARVYIETTVPSYYYETRRTIMAQAWREATRRWWDTQRRRYEVVTSAYVLTELEAAPLRKRTAAMRILSGIPLLKEPPGFRDVVLFYIEQRLMPQDAEGDAAHLALASLHGVDFLLTWNCQHLANANKTRHLAVLNGRLGLHVPVLTTPLTLLAEDMP